MKNTSALVILFLTLFRLEFLSACGCIMPIYPPELPPPPATKGAPSLKSERIQIRVLEQVAQIEIDQIFVNDSDATLEGEYLLPVNEEAMVGEFSYFLDGRKITADIAETGEAEERFARQTRRNQRAVIGKSTGPALFTFRMSPMKPREERRVVVKLSEILPYDNGSLQLRLRTRGIEGGRGTIGGFHLDFEIKDSKEIQKLFSPSHKLDIATPEKNRGTARFEEKNFHSDRDLLIYALLKSSETATAFKTFKSPKEDRGYFMFTVSPPETVEADSAIPRAVTFVFDTSGSMRGEKIEQARKTLEFCLGNLPARDRFRLITFSTDVDEFNRDFLPATRENIDRAIAFAAAIKAVGSTHIEGAMTRALAKDPAPNPGFVIFMTDGNPTVGETSIGKLIKIIKNNNKFHQKVFTFGVGNDISRQLLTIAARDSGAVADYIRSGDNLEDKMSLFFDRIRFPLWLNPMVEFGGAMQTSEIYPNPVPDLYRGSRLLIIGRFRGEGSTAVKVKAKTQNEKGIAETFEYSLASDGDNTFLPRLWAQKRVQWLEESLDVDGDNPEAKEEIIKLGKEWNLATRFTAFVSRDEASPQLVHAPGSPAPMAREKLSMNKGGMGAPGGASFEMSRDSGGAGLDMGLATAGEMAQKTDSRPSLSESKKREDGFSAPALKQQEQEKDKQNSVAPPPPVDKALALVESHEGIQGIIETGDGLSLVKAGESKGSMRCHPEESPWRELPRFHASKDLKLLKIFESMGGEFVALLAFEGKVFLVHRPVIVGGRYRVISLSVSSVEISDIRDGNFLSLRVE